VAVVGTRHATPDGRSVAFELGRDLVEAGVCVVSGLALGIDAAAHSGAIEALRRLGDDAPAATVGVAASGVDVPYPRRHAGLWEEVVRLGAVVSETPPGRAAQAWRFPMRNRVIAGLVRMVVVVESHARGGSLITAEAALERGVDVRVVPGPVHSPASAGSNQLLYDGPGPVRNARDVLDGLGMIGPLQTATCPRTGPRQGPGSPDEASQVGCEQADEASQVGFEQADEAVLAAVGWQPTTLNRVAIRTGRSIGSAAGSLERLASLGWVRGDQGWWTRVR
jgi:DNA processing protein